MKSALFALALVSLALLAPARWGIALNYQTQECAGYWAGDEYVGYHLPDGWQDYYPDSTGRIQTNIGSCQWQTAGENREQNCCQQLGYTYVSPNIGERLATPSPYTIFIIGGVVCVGILLLAVVVGGLGLLAGLLGVGGYFAFGRKSPKR